MQFHHHPDGLIYLRTDHGVYEDTVEHFEQDAGSYSGLPPGMIERRYEPEQYHVLVSADYGQTGGVMPWTEGDGLLAAFEQIIHAQQARRDRERAGMG